MRIRAGGSARSARRAALGQESPSRIFGKQRLNGTSNSLDEAVDRKSQSLLVSDDDVYISSGLDFWFTPAGAKAKVPVRWKQYLLTWSAIYPLVLGVPQLVTPALGAIGFSPNVLLNTLATTAVVVYLMVYVIMPRYTRLVRRWLYG